MSTLANMVAEMADQGEHLDLIDLPSISFKYVRQMNSAHIASDTEGCCPNAIKIKHE